MLRFEGADERARAAMNCDDIQKGIYVYLDDEFADPERRDFEGHVRACARCRRRVERERGFLASFRSKVPQVTAPAGLEDRIRAALAAAPAPESGLRELPRRGGAWRQWWVAAAALTLVATPALIVWRAAGSGSAAGEERVAVEALQTHQRDLPMEVRGSQRQIREFLQANVPFEVELPPGSDPRLELIGARLTRVDGREAVLLNYAVEDERLSVLQVAAPAIEAPHEDAPPTFSSQAGFDIATFRKRGVLSSVVGSGGSGSVQRLVKAAYLGR